MVPAGMFARNPVTSPARSFLSLIGVEGWARLSLAEQCATRGRTAGWWGG